jgi:hypothetical protein
MDDDEEGCEECGGLNDQHFPGCSYDIDNNCIDDEADDDEDW